MNKRYKYTDRQLLEFLKRFYKRNGRTPTQKELQKSKEMPSPFTFVLRFGSHANALRAAGLPKHTRWRHSYERKITKEELLQKLRDYYSKHGKVPATHKVAGILPSAETYRKNFGTWNNALRSAGLPVNIKYIRTTWLSRILRKIADRLDIRE